MGDAAHDKPSKAQEFDECVLLAVRHQKNFAQALIGLQGQRTTDQKLFQVAQAQVAAAFKAAAAGRELEALGQVHPYRLRHVGATRDLMGGQRSG